MNEDEPATRRQSAALEALQGLFPSRGPGAKWEPPLDLIMTDTAIIAYVALPGVDLTSVEIRAESEKLILRGQRRRPLALREASILRLELPSGPFERQVPIPKGQYDISYEAAQGCVVIYLMKIQEDTEQ